MKTTKENKRKNTAGPLTPEMIFAAQMVGLRWGPVEENYPKDSSDMITTGLKGDNLASHVDAHVGIENRMVVLDKNKGRTYVADTLENGKHRLTFLNNNGDRWSHLLSDNGITTLSPPDAYDERLHTHNG